MHILELVRWPTQEADVCCCYCFYRNIFILLLISLLCNSQRLLGDPVTKQICAFPRRGNDPRTTVGIRTCLWSCSLQYKSTYLNIMSFCAVDCVYFVFLFVSLNIKKWSHCHLCFSCPRSSFIGSYFVHLNVLCSFTSVFMFSLYLYFVKEEGLAAQAVHWLLKVIHDFVIVFHNLYLCFYICICICICSYTFILRRGNDGKLACSWP